MGTIEGLRIDAITALGRWLSRADGERCEKVTALLLRLAGEPEDWVRRAAIIALKHAEPSLQNRQRPRALRQIEVALHDSAVGVQSAATWALPTFASQITSEDAPFFVQRLQVLNNSKSPEVRVNVAQCLQHIANLPTFESEHENILNQLQMMTQDVSFRVRSCAERLREEVRPPN